MTHPSGDPWSSELRAQREALTRSAAVVRPRQPGIFVLSGPDALRFAQGMFTQDVRAVPAGQGRSAAMVDDEGRLLGLLWVHGLPDSELLCLLDDRDLAWFRLRFEIQLLLDDVRITDLRDVVGVIGLRGPLAEVVLRAVGLPVPEADGQHVLHDRIRVIRRPGDGAQGFELLVPLEETEARAASLVRAGARPVSEEACLQFRILQGVPALPFDADEDAGPHELGIADQVCSFRKGHYLGQSALVRWQGDDPPRRLCGLDLGRAPVPSVGSSVWFGPEQVGRLGSTTSVDGRCVALALLRRDVARSGRVLAVGHTPAGVHAQVCDLPFPPLPVG